MRKHFEEKSKKVKKIKVKLVLFYFILLSTIICIVIYFSENLENEDVKINNTINNAFTALKTTNIEEINKYMDYNKLVSSLDQMILEDNSDKVSNLEKKLFDSMKWETNSIKIEENKVIVNIKMKNKDFKEILTKWIEKIIEEKEKNTNISIDMALDILEKIILENKTEKIVIKDIFLERQGENFTIVVDNELRNLIFPGIESVAAVVNKK